MAEKTKSNVMQPNVGLYGFDANRLGRLGGLAKKILDPLNRLRYGMTEEERSQLIGRIPGSPFPGRVDSPENERFLSGMLYSRQWPNVAGPGMLKAANAFTDWKYGTDLAPHAVAGGQLAENLRTYHGRDLTNEELKAAAALEDQRRTAALVAGRKK